MHLFLKLWDSKLFKHKVALTLFSTLTWSFVLLGSQDSIQTQPPVATELGLGARQDHSTTAVVELRYHHGFPDQLNWLTKAINNGCEQESLECLAYIHDQIQCHMTQVLNEGL